MNEDEILRNARAAHTLLPACADHYMTAAKEGKLKEWAAMAHSMIDLLACDGTCGDLDPDR